MFVDPTIVHDDHRIGPRIWLHLVKQACNKFGECCGTERSFDNVAVHDALIQRERRENGKPAK